MQDRVPTPGQEGRVLITPESGEPFYAKIQMADNPTQDGTPLNMTTLLKNATAALYGMTAAAVPDDVLSFLGQYALYWWARQPVDAGINLGSTTTRTFNYLYSGSYTIYYSAELDIKSLNYVALKDPQMIINTGNWDTQANRNLKGKYFIVPPDANQADSNKILYMPESANASNGVTAGTRIPCQLVTLNITDTGDLEYVSSNSPDAYPNSGVSDGYIYQAIGRPLQNIQQITHVAIGSYTGTENYGLINPNSLVFDFAPKAMTIIGPWRSRGVAQDGQLQIFFDFFTGKYIGSYGGDETITYSGNCAVDDNTVYWYGSDINNQLNAKGYVYCYYAIE